MTCLIVGDSIAVGLAAMLPFCAVDAAVGLSSAGVVGKARPAEVLVISAGSNDPYNNALAPNLRAIRDRAAGKVVWVLPGNQVARETVVRVAAERKDRVVGFTPAPDGVHPRSYGELAAKVCQ